MSELARDIETLLDAAFHELAGVEIGTIENCDGPSIVIDSKVSNMAITREELSLMFSKSPATSRIAIVYLRRVQDTAYSGAWAQAARDFYEEDIAGVLVIGGNTLAASLGDAGKANLGWATDVTAVEKKMFDLFPDVFKEAGFPILFDESRVLCDIMPKNHLLDHDGHLHFVFSNEPRSLDLVHKGYWFEPSYFPVFDAARSTREYEFARRIAEGARCKEEWSLSDAIHAYFEDPMQQRKSRSLASCAEYINNLFGEVFDIEDLMLFGGESRRLDVSYAIDIPKGANEDLDRVLRQVKLASDIRRLLKITFPDIISEEFDWCRSAEICRERGVDHQMRALGAGVPFEDVMA